MTVKKDKGRRKKKKEKKREKNGASALSAHMIHINLNMILCTHGEHSPTKTIYLKYYKKYIYLNKQKTCMFAFFNGE